MAEPDPRFADGAAYERGMGVWSRIVGESFLDWLAPPPGLRWLDVGCGSGALTELLMQRCAPAECIGVDPSEAQLAFARQRPGARGAVFQAGEASALPFPGERFDAAASALVLHFIADPAAAVAEMVRVVRRGGTVASYVWQQPDGTPIHPLQAGLRAIGITPRLAPSIAACGLEPLRALWTGAGLAAVAAREIVVQRTFADFDTFWAFTTGTGSLRPTLLAMPPGDLLRLRDIVRAALPADAQGRITHSAHALAIRGSVAGEYA